MAKVKHVGLRRWWQQEQRCLWCGDWTWHPAVITKTEARRVLGIELGTRHSGKRLRRSMASVEHILPKSLGGTDGHYNLACACRLCNSTRSSDVHSLRPILHIAAKLPPEVIAQLHKVGLDMG